ncbi:MAG: hypothetical protein RLZZ216_701 [Cyanobacteriota bacterium]
MVGAADPWLWIKVVASTGMPRSSFLVMLLALGMAPVAAQPGRGLPLSAGQSILEADAVLVSSGWRPHPIGPTLPLDQERAGVPLTSLSACSGTGVGFCRFDYRRNGRQLSVVTIPAPARVERGRAIGGVVERWWVETVGP